MQIVILIVSAMLILTGLVVVHELGHYLVAKKRGIQVAEFAIGFGPRLIKWHRGETEFSFRPLLFGGFVKFADDVEKQPGPGDFRAASLKSRVLTILAGPVMNVLLAFVLVVIMLMSASEFQAVKIAAVQPNSPAAAAGLEAGDVIREMNGVEMNFYASGLQQYAQTQKGDSVPVQVERDGSVMSYEVPFGAENEEKLIGITMQPSPHSFFEAIGLSFEWLGEQMGAILSALGKLFFMGQGIENMSGIVGTAVVVGNVVQYGTYGLVLMLIALISVNLAIINLLPIPALDGGKIVLYAVEGVRKKPAPEKVEGILNFIGLALIMGLAVFMVFQDIGRLMG